jgi:hypothetical protein
VAAGEPEDGLEATPEHALAIEGHLRWFALAYQNFYDTREFVNLSDCRADAAWLQRTCR